MGQLVYGSTAERIELDDRVLAHLQIVMISKLRRSEPFLLTIPADQEAGTLRHALWMHPTIPVQFVFSGSRAPVINRAWLEELNRAANSNRGLSPLPEPGPARSQSVAA